jgi:hypothetical protein
MPASLDGGGSTFQIDSVALLDFPSVSSRLTNILGA